MDVGVMLTGLAGILGAGLGGLATFSTTRHTVSAERQNVQDQLLASGKRAKEERAAHAWDRSATRREQSIIDLQVALGSLMTETAQLADTRVSQSQLSSVAGVPRSRTIDVPSKAYLDAFRLSQQFRQDEEVWEAVLVAIDDKRIAVLNEPDIRPQSRAMDEFVNSIKVAIDELGILLTDLDALVQERTHHDSPDLPRWPTGRPVP